MYICFVNLIVGRVDLSFKQLWLYYFSLKHLMLWNGSRAKYIHRVLPHSPAPSTVCLQLFFCFVVFSIMASAEKTEECPFADIFNEDEAERNYLLSKPTCFIIFGKPVSYLCSHLVICILKS